MTKGRPSAFTHGHARLEWRCHLRFERNFSQSAGKFALRLLAALRAKHV